MNEENARVAMCLLAQREVGSSLYWWGGDGVSGRKELGRDCSGLVCSILADLALAYPVLYDGQRRTARGIYDYFDALGLRLVVAQKPHDVLVAGPLDAEPKLLGRLATGALLLAASLEKVTRREPMLTLEVDGGGPAGRMFATASPAGWVRRSSMANR